ncbi:MAG: DUF362 domain-containing protein [Candidatus Aminicenantes bacterium]|nr:MAG: DUF362 domain-containing protein [Candidatus Aminicenantes bacterium]
MPKTKVSIQRVPSYESEAVRLALLKNLEFLGGLDQIVRPKSRVFVKINHLSPPSPPENMIVTHPIFTKELLILLLDLGCEITVGDDIQSNKEDGFHVSGYRKICAELGVRLVNLKETGFREIACQGQILNKAYISPLVLDSDFLINLPKLKTHSFIAYTGAIKNMYGVIPHGLRCRYHRKYEKSEIFCQMLVDIFSLVPPHLNIMDAIYAMEGEGPSAGSPKKVGLILASFDAIALDSVATKIIGLDPMQIHTTTNAAHRKLGTAQMDEIELLGEKLQDVEIKDFKQSAISVGLIRKNLPSFLHGFIQSQLVLIPRVLPKQCTACKECVDICPTGAAQMLEGKARIDKSGCIHCMCCHEVCRFHAIKLGQRPLGRILRQMTAIYKKILSHFS